jgi:transposase-like protein
MTRHSPYVIKLSAADRAELEKRSRSYTARHADIVRAKIVLLSADGNQNTAIAARLDVHVNVVRKWRKRFFEAGLDGLADRPRPGRPRSVPSGVAEVRAMDGEPAAERREPLSQRSSTEPPARAVSLDALRHLVTSINLVVGTELGKRVALVDTERGSAAKYADQFSFDTRDRSLAIVDRHRSSTNLGTSSTVLRQLAADSLRR